MAMAAFSSSIMEAIGGNPFSTVVGQKVEQATDPSLAAEDWAHFMEICDLVNELEDGPKDAIRAIRKRLQQFVGKNYTVVLYSLTLLETCVKNCGHRFHVLACTRDSIQDLVKLIGPKYDPPQAVQEKVLALIQCWAEAFRQKPDLQGVVQIYNELRAKGVQFPPTDLDSMAPIQTPPRSIESEPRPTSPRRAAPSSTDGPQPPSSTSSSSSGAIVAPVAFRLTADQIGKLRSELDIVEANMKVLSEMLTELKPGEEHPEDGQLLQDLHETCRAMQQRVVALISQVNSDELTADLLRVNDDLNSLFLRYGKYQRARNSKDGEKTPLKEEAGGRKEVGSAGAGAGAAAAASLIDFGEEDLSSGVAGMNVGSRPGPEVDSEFDMFAQSRSASSKSHGATYEDNINIDTTSASLGEAAQTRLHPKSDDDVLNPQLQKESDFEEMESWLKTQAPSSAGHKEGLTSSEFDEFLAERATASERAPPPRRPKTTEKEEDAMFGL